MFAIQILKSYFKQLILIICGFVIIVGGYIYQLSNGNATTFIETPSQRQTISLNIQGDVNKPGEYDVPSDLTVNEVINKFSGGIKATADPIVEIITTNPDMKPFEKIKINTATVTDLQQIKGIGKLKAEKIIDYRNTNGPFKNKEDLMNVNGFGEKTVEKILPYIDFSV